MLRKVAHKANPTNGFVPTVSARFLCLFMGVIDLGLYVVLNKVGTFRSDAPIAW